MAEDTLADNEQPAMASGPAHRRPLWLRILKWLGIAIAALVLLAIAIVLGINTDPGRRFVADQIGGYTTASGLNIKVGRIDGSLYGQMVLTDVRVSDPKGVFLDSPRIAVDWRPFAFINNHVDVRSAEAELITMRRNPELKPSAEPADPNAPLLPDLDIDIGRLTVSRLVMEAPVAGSRHIARIDGRTHIADRRAQLTVDAATIRAPGVAGGDVARLRIDAVPDDNKLDIDVRLNAPVGGVVAELGSLKAPLTATIGGAGSWKAWNGRVAAQLGAGELANLGLTARNGHFELRGVTRPGLYLEGPVERLTAPGLQLAADATLHDGRKVDTRITAKSDELAVDAGGLLDLASSRLGNFAVDAKLLTPGAIAPNLRGRDVLARIVLNGPFATPTVDYKLRAAAIGFGTTGVEDIYAEGLAKVDANRILVPVHARARRVTGLNAALGGLTNNARIDGDIAIAMPNILSDNLRIRSDTINATAIIAANMETGRYTGGLQGRVNGYRVDSVGIFNVNTQADLVAVNGGFGVTGRVALQSTRWLNDGIRNFLGGNVVASTRFGYSPEGIATFRDLRVNSPQFRVTRGQGKFNPANGAVAVDADAFSTQYGPLYARVTGSATAPVVRVRAPRPGVGIGLANLDARVVGRNGAYAVNASGGTNYGPFTADVSVRPGGQLAVDIRRVLFAGINFAGRVVQTAAGPFAGGVRFAGSGLTGNVGLGAQGRYQHAAVKARAYAATIPGMVDFTIGRAIVDADVVMLPKAPQIVADAQVGDMRYGPTVIEAARAKVNYTGGRGTAQALLTGSSGVPFRLAANAQLAPNDYRVALQGTANGVGFRTVNPARIVGERGGYRLQPTRLDFDQGSLRVAGRYGNGMAAQARLDRLNLAILNAVMPGLGLGGQATGSLDFVQTSSSAFPQADARVNVTNFTRSSLAAVSQPVDIVFQGRLGSSAGEARALIKRGPTAVGRLLATLTPSGSGSWSSRLMRGPLSGGLRYNGPSGVLFSLAALPQQQLSGPIAIAADFAGTVSAPRVNGLIRADNLTYDNETYGTRLSNMQIAARFTNDRLELTNMSARAGSGTVQAQGNVGIAAAQGFPMDIRVTMNNAQLARSDSLGATASGNIRIQNAAGGGLISGDINIPDARYQIVMQGSADVPELTGVRKKSEIRVARPTDRPASAPAVGLFKLDLRVHADNRLYVSGMGLESEWQMNLQVGGTSSAPTIGGGLDLVRGTYSFAGKRFDVSRGEVRFRGGALTDPDINILATTVNDGITFNIAITGTGQRPQIAFTSTPALPQDEVLSRLLFGASPENLSAMEAIQLASALNSLRGSGGGLNPLGKLRSATGFDRLRILGADQASGRGQALAAGKYLTDNIYVEIVTDARGFTATQLTVALTKAISVLSQAGSFGGSNVQMRYSRDF